MTPTLGELVNGGFVTAHECKAMRHLHADGRSMNEVGFLLERNSKTVSKHVQKRCACD